jgi:catechol 2,3-dioxygenase-like lactoylglutathione lyase family enzyme
MQTTPARKTRFENAAPILRVRDLAASVRYYVDVLGFTNAEWAMPEFTLVTRDRAGLYLCQGGQGQPGTWAWIGVDDVAQLHDEYRLAGARLRGQPRNYPWAYELQVEDPDGHVLRFGSEPRADLPFAEGPVEGPV